MRLCRVSLAMGCALLFLPMAAQNAATASSGPAEAKQEGPSFDVSTVKVNNTGSGSVHVSIDGDSLRGKNVRLNDLMEAAWDIRRDQIVGLPHWAEVEHYDIAAKAVDVDPARLREMKDDEMRLRMQHLLMERFHLQAHTEMRTLPLLNLVVVKDGIKFEEWKKPADGEKGGGFMNVHNTELTATGIEMRSIAMFLSGQTHMPVQDKTGLTGKYNLHLRWRREEEGQPSGLHDDELPTIYAAITEQLGLKLESGKGPVQVLVVDHIEQPEEN